MKCIYCGEYFPAITPKKFCSKLCGQKYRALKGKTKMHQFPFEFFKAAVGRSNSWLELDKNLREAAK